MKRLRDKESWVSRAKREKDCEDIILEEKERCLKEIRAVKDRYEPKCTFNRVPSPDVCKYCSAYCELREPKVNAIAACSFKEYLRGVFEINNGIKNDPDLLVRLHAPTLLELAKKESYKESLHIPESCKENGDSFTHELEKEIERYFAGYWPGCETDEQCNTPLTFMPPAIIRLARHFAEWGAEHLKR